jgi:hypothetical protein
MNLKPLLQKHYDWLILLAAAGILASASLNLSVKQGDFELRHVESGSRQMIRLPLVQSSLTGGGTYELQGQIVFGWAASRLLHITPDDEVKSIAVNGEPVDLSDIPGPLLSDWINGFTLDLGPYAGKRENSISIVFSDYGGDMGMRIKPLSGERTVTLLVLWLALALAAVVRICGVAMVRKYSGPAGFVLAAVLLAWTSFNLNLDFSDFELYHFETDKRETVKLPFTRSTDSTSGTYELKGQFSFRWAAPKVLHIIPDDVVSAIVINGTEVDLSGIPENALSDWVNGFVLDVGPYIKERENQIAIVFTDFGGNMGMKIGPPPGGARVVALSLLWLALAWIAFIKAPFVLRISRLHTVLYALIILGALLRVWTIYTYNPVDHIFSDSQRHWEQGEDVLRNDLMSNVDPIMYQLYVGTLLKLSLNMHALVAFYTCVLALLGPWIWYRFLRELQGNKTFALAGWATLSLLPSWISIYSYFMQETLLIPLLGAALWATWRARRKGTVRYFAWMVVLWTVAGLTRGIAIPLAAVCCSALWLTQDQKLKKALVSACILLFIMGPLTYRSYQTVHHFAPHGMGHLAAIYGMSGKQEIILHVKKGWSAGYGFGSPSMDAKIFEPFSDWVSRRKGQVLVRVDLDRGWEDWEKAYDQVTMSWRDALWITKENLIFLMFASSWPDNNDTRLVDWFNIHMRWLWAPALLAAMIWIFMLRRRLNRQWLLPSLILTWFIVQGVLPIAVNEGRYRKPFEGMIIAQLLALAAVSRGQARNGQAYDLGVDLSRWLPRKKPSTPTERAPPAIDQPPPDAADAPPPDSRPDRAA